MGSRYLVSGTQLAILKEGIKPEFKHKLKHIQESQYIGDSYDSVPEDVAKLFGMLRKDRR